MINRAFTQKKAARIASDYSQTGAECARVRGRIPKGAPVPRSGAYIPRGSATKYEATSRRLVAPLLFGTPSNWGAQTIGVLPYFFGARPPLSRHSCIDS